MSTQQVSAPVRVDPEDEPLLCLDLSARGPVTVIAVSGEVDLSTAHLITELVQHVARDRPARVVLDLAGVSFFGADGVRALIRARRTITAAGGQLVLRAPSPRTWRILVITGTDQLFPLDTGMGEPVWEPVDRRTTGTSRGASERRCVMVVDGDGTRDDPRVADAEPKDRGARSPR